MFFLISFKYTWNNGIFAYVRYVSYVYFLMLLYVYVFLSAHTRCNVCTLYTPMYTK
jgi:hypothetical protein